MINIIGNNILFFLFFISITYIIYYLIRIIHLLLSLYKDKIKDVDFMEIKNNLFNDKKLIIFWITSSFFLFYIFY